MIKQSRLDWFNELRTLQFANVNKDFPVLVEIAVDPGFYKILRLSTSRYIKACLDINEEDLLEDRLIEHLESNVSDLANRTPNGILIPKMEFEDEFNDLHRVLAGYIRTLGMDNAIHVVSSPIIVRLVKGHSELDLDDRPYSSTKIHMDPWNGDPGDEVVVSIPIFGDIENTTVEYFEPPDEFRAPVMNTMTNYDEGQKLMGDCQPIELAQRLGYAYFMDAIVPHRTIKNNGGVRVTLEFRLRRITSDEERKSVEETCDPGRLSHFVEVSDWYKLGTTKRMKFSDTNSDAKKGIFVKRPYNEPIYSIEDIDPSKFD